MPCRGVGGLLCYVMLVCWMLSGWDVCTAVFKQLDKPIFGANGCGRCLVDVGCCAMRFSGERSLPGAPLPSRPGDVRWRASPRPAPRPPPRRGRCGSPPRRWRAPEKGRERWGMRECPSPMDLKISAGSHFGKPLMIRSVLPCKLASWPMKKKQKHSLLAM